MIIEGFKSYKDQTVLEPFSNKINVVGERRRGACCCCCCSRRSCRHRRGLRFPPPPTRRERQLAAWLHGRRCQRMQTESQCCVADRGVDNLLMCAGHPAALALKLPARRLLCSRRQRLRQVQLLPW